MFTITYLIVVMSFRGDPIPGPEFKVKSDCEIVVQQLKSVSPLPVFGRRVVQCVEIKRTKQ